MLKTLVIRITMNEEDIAGAKENISEYLGDTPVTLYDEEYEVVDFEDVNLRRTIYQVLSHLLCLPDMETPPPQSAVDEVYRRIVALPNYEVGAMSGIAVQQEVLKYIMSKIQ